MCKVMPYIASMIRSFKNKGLRQYAETGNPKGLSVQNHDRVRRIIRALDAAGKPEAMDIPGLKFHALKGDQKGRFSVWVSGNWRITFAFAGEDAIDVDLEDYHR
jgi:proteic killer suppression protein